MANLTAPFDPPVRPGKEIRIKMAAQKIYAGGAVGIIRGTGYATPLVIATNGIKFHGVAEETIDNSGGSAGDKWIRLRREGLAVFNQSGLVQADVGSRAFFSDDNTVTTTPGYVFAGEIVTIDEANGQAWVDITNAVRTDPTMPIINFTASGTIGVHGANVVAELTRQGTITLQAPTATTDEGVEFTFINNATYANVLSAAGLILSGTTGGSTATASASSGGLITLVAITVGASTRWVIKANSGFAIA